MYQTWWAWWVPRIGIVGLIIFCIVNGFDRSLVAMSDAFLVLSFLGEWVARRSLAKARKNTRFKGSTTTVSLEENGVDMVGEVGNSHSKWVFAPTADRESWLFVTSGLSNDWESSVPDSSGVSGLGCEFVFETTGAGDWAILRLLHLMTFQILLAHGRYEGKEPLGLYDRLPLRGSIRPEPSEIQSLIIAPSAYEAVSLESGRFVLYQVVGITQEEVAFAQAYGGAKLQEQLVAANAFPVADPDRHSVRLA
jgi:hypothetical protein